MVDSLEFPLLLSSIANRHATMYSCCSLQFCGEHGIYIRHLMMTTVAVRSWENLEVSTCLYFFCTVNSVFMFACLSILLILSAASYICVGNNGYGPVGVFVPACILWFWLPDYVLCTFTFLPAVASFWIRLLRIQSMSKFRWSPSQTVITRLSREPVTDSFETSQ